MILPLSAWSSICNSASTIAICAAMPTLIVWLCLKTRNQKFNKRIELAKLAIDKNPSLDIDDFLSKISSEKKTYAQKSVTLILISSILLFLGLAATAVSIIFHSQDIQDGYLFFSVVACVLLGIGLSFLVAFLYARNLIHKGILK